MSPKSTPGAGCQSIFWVVLWLPHVSKTKLTLTLGSTAHSGLTSPKLPFIFQMQLRGHLLQEAFPDTSHSQASIMFATPHSVCGRVCVLSPWR